MHLGIRDRDDRFGRRCPSADHAGRAPDVSRRVGQLKSHARHVARDVETSRHSAANADHDVPRLQRELGVQAAVQRPRVPQIALPRQCGQLQPDVRRHVELPVECDPGFTERVLLDRGELQTSNEFAAFGELHVIAATEIGQDLFVLRIIANALHQVVEIDDQRTESKLLRAECRSRAERATADDQGVEDIRQGDRTIEDEGAIRERIVRHNIYFR